MGYESKMGAGLAGPVMRVAGGAWVVAAVGALGGCYVEAQAGAYAPLGGPVHGVPWSAGGSIGFHFDATRAVGMSAGLGAEPVIARSSVPNTGGSTSERTDTLVTGPITTRLDVNFLRWSQPRMDYERTFFVGASGGFSLPGWVSGEGGNAWSFFLGGTFGFYGFQTNGLQMSLVGNYVSSESNALGHVALFGPQVRLRFTLGPKLVGQSLLPWNW